MLGALEENPLGRVAFGIAVRLLPFGCRTPYFFFIPLCDSSLAGTPMRYFGQPRPMAENELKFNQAYRTVHHTGREMNEMHRDSLTCLTSPNSPQTKNKLKLVQLDVLQTYDVMKEFTGGRGTKTLPRIFRPRS